MKMRFSGIFLLLMLLLVLLTGCNFAATDDVARVGQAVVKNYGDDLLINSRRLLGNEALQYGDDYARMVSSSLDDLLINKQAGQSVDDIVSEFTPYADDILSRAPTAMDIPPPRVIYQTPRSQWSATQIDVFNELIGRLSMREDEAELFLGTTCSVVDYIKIFDEYPSEEYSLFYALLLAGVQKFEPPQQEYAEFIESVFEFVAALIEGQEAASLQEAGEIVFDGLCLIQ